MIETLLGRLMRSPETLRRLATVINLVLLTGLMLKLAELSWQLAPVPATVSPAMLASPPASPIPSSGPPRPASWNIARWHLFGKVRHEATPAIPVPKALPETHLNLVLRGIVSSTNEQGGGAIIDAGNGQEVYYPVGAALPGGARLHTVHRDHVVLQRNGQLEILKLPRDEIATPASSRGRQPRQALQAPPSRGGLARLRQQILTNPQQLLNVFSVEPYTQRGQFIGYRLRPGRDVSLFNLTGLKNGDIVTSINGIRLDTPAKAMNALRGLAQATSARLTVRRNGRPQSVFVDLSR